MLMMTNMIDVVNNVASALRETRPIHVDPTFYLTVMEMQGFTIEMYSSSTSLTHSLLFWVPFWCSSCAW